MNVLAPIVGPWLLRSHPWTICVLTGASRSGSPSCPVSFAPLMAGFDCMPTTHTMPVSSWRHLGWTPKMLWQSRFCGWVPT
ncbi:Uncharacterised protein [Mycobacteroides abscessus subsp. abscessus]|nr:Uncharacterised protein [Mycobacteroides abscessus subsp. abscessus]